MIVIGEDNLTHIKTWLDSSNVAHPSIHTEPYRRKYVVFMGGGTFKTLKTETEWQEFHQIRVGRHK